MRFFILGLFILAACGSGEKKSEGPTPAPTPAVVAPLGPQITKTGDNQMGRFSPDGLKIVFQSRNRSNHKSAQIYVLNLQTKKERRITFNDGDDFFPSFDSTGKFLVYSSTTDEIKEHPQSSTIGPDIYNDPAQILESKIAYEELYESLADGSHIRRLTNSAGFDGQADFASAGARVAFVSQRGDDFDLEYMDLRARHPSQVISTKDALAHPSFSPNGKTILFESRSGSKGPVHIKTVAVWGKKIVQLTSKDAINRDPSWTPDGKRLVFTSNRDQENFYGIYSMSEDGTCLKKLTQAPEIKSKTDFVADLYPTVSPDGKKLLYSSNRSGSWQLYLVDFTEPVECQTDKP